MTLVRVSIVIVWLRRSEHEAVDILLTSHHCRIKWGMLLSYTPYSQNPLGTRFCRGLALIAAKARLAFSVCAAIIILLRLKNNGTPGRNMARRSRVYGI